MNPKTLICASPGAPPNNTPSGANIEGFNRESIFTPDFLSTLRLANNEFQRRGSPMLALSPIEQIGLDLRAIRIRKQLSVHQVAAQAGISTGLLNNIEWGLVLADEFMQTLPAITSALGLNKKQVFFLITAALKD